MELNPTDIVIVELPFRRPCDESSPDFPGGAAMWWTDAHLASSLQDLRSESIEVRPKCLDSGAWMAWRRSRLGRAAKNVERVQGT